MAASEKNKRVLSRIEFFEKVPISSDFKNEPLFDSAKDQANFFGKFKNEKLVIPDSSYQRVETQIRTKFKYEELLHVNYVHVVNPSYAEAEPSNGWYGFVMDIHYIDDGLVTVDWVVDPVQTFMFDWYLSSAYIERGMMDSVIEKDGKYYLSNEGASLLAMPEPVGVDGLAYELAIDNITREVTDEDSTAFLVIVTTDAAYRSFVGTPSQLNYYVVPFNKKTGFTEKYSIKNVKGSGADYPKTIEVTEQRELMSLLEALGKDAKFSKGGGEIVTAYFTNEFGMAFIRDKDTKMLLGEMNKYEGIYNSGGNMEIYEFGGTSGGGSTGGTGGTDGSSSGGNTGSGTVPEDKKEFMKLNVGHDFKVNEAKFIAGAKKSARVMAWLGGDDNNIKRVADIVKKNGVSPEFFFAYDIQEQGTGYGWLNHTYYTGDPYGDADSVSKWLVAAANDMGPISLAWSDLGYTTPADKQAAGNAFIAEMPAGSIGRIYLQGTAASVWAMFDPEALKASVNGVQDYGDPIAGVMELLKNWE